jgi:predicted transcriptional regulator YheO
MNTKEDIFKTYLVIMDFLSELLGKNHEIVLHDLADLNKSIIAIKNNKISGRDVGGPATDLVLKILNNKELQKKNYIANYKGYGKNGNEFRSSTFFIRNKKDKLIGMLCINSDLSSINNLVDAVQCIVSNYNVREYNLDSISLSENLSSSFEELTKDSIESVINTKNISPERMTPDEKIEIVQELNQKGVFLLKGAVSEVAQHLKSSEASIYRYLSKIK